jgi:hypothetical protein
MKTSRTLLLVLCFAGLFSKCFSQDIPAKKNSLYFELFGNAGYYSINYERSFHPNIYCRIGFETFATSGLFDRTTTGRITAVPVIVSFLTGHGKHHLEFGGGLLLGNKREFSVSNTIINLTSFLGYRYQSMTDNGFLFRLGLTPMVSLTGANYPDRYFLSAGLSIGYHF